VPVEDWRERLRQQYLAGLPEKLDAIEALLGELKATPADRQALARLRGALHRLAGSAGTHGLEAVGWIASSWEERLASIEGESPGADELERMEAWLEEVRHSVHSSAAAPALPSGTVSPSTDGASPSPETRVPALRVLVVDDASSVRQVTRLMLDRLGQRADGASSGVEALDAVLREPYDLVLMDVQMPDMDGLEATRRIRARGALRRQPRIVAMSAGRAAGDVERCRAAGMDGYVVKPVAFDDLRRELAAAASAPGDRAGE
jgi:CheY-like chemotaxis protein